MMQIRSGILFAVALLGLCAWPHVARPVNLGLEVTPGKLEVSIPAGLSYNIPITVHNSGFDSTYVQATMVDFGVTMAGNYQFEKVGKRPYSLMKYAAIRPRAFNIAPGTSQQVQLTITMPHNPHLAGEYAGIIFFQTRPQRQAHQAVAFSERVASKIYETIPNTVKVEGAITKMNAIAAKGGEIYRIMFHNTGNAHVYLRGQVAVQKKGGGAVYQVALPNNELVERGGNRLLEVTGKRLPPGAYQAIATIDYGGKTDTAGGINVTVR